MAGTSTQQFLEIEQVKEGVVILKDRSVRGILMVSSLNFALKSEEEQNAILYQFQNFLNSLDFSLEITIHSSRLNITGYLDKLKDLEKKHENELLKIQATEYRKFVEELVKGGAILTKTFFVSIPFHLTAVKPLAATGLGRLLKKPSVTMGALTEETFQRAKSQLWQRMEFVALGLKRCGLEVIPLNTTELIELFWSFHHPEEAEVGYYPELPPELIQ